MFSGVPAVLEFSEYLVDTYEDALRDATGRCVNQLDIIVRSNVELDSRWVGLSGSVGAFEEGGELAIGATDPRVAPIVADVEYGHGSEPPAPLLRSTMLHAQRALSKTFDRTLEQWY
jgi:hypothetical protein